MNGIKAEWWSRYTGYLWGVLLPRGCSPKHLFFFIKKTFFSWQRYRIYGSVNSRIFAGRHILFSFPFHLYCQVFVFLTRNLSRLLYRESFIVLPRPFFTPHTTSVYFTHSNKERQTRASAKLTSHRHPWTHTDNTHTPPAVIPDILSVVVGLKSHRWIKFVLLGRTLMDITHTPCESLDMLKKSRYAAEPFPLVSVS